MNGLEILVIVLDFHYECFKFESCLEESDLEMFKWTRFDE